jgi:hypothetical protein
MQSHQLFDLNTVTLLKMNDDRFMNEEQKEMLRQWNNLSPEVRQNIENDILVTRGPILMTVKFEAISRVSKEELESLLRTRTMKHVNIKNIGKIYTKFTDIHTKEKFIYENEYPF